MTSTVRRGRRPGSPDTRSVILAVARERFAEQGYAATSVRRIAAAAGVDPALVHHYFGTKNDLFLAALELPVDPTLVVERMVTGGLPGAGERIVRTMLAVWDDEAMGQPMLALVRRVVEPGGGWMFHDGVLRLVLLPVGRGLGIDQVERRMALVASQVFGAVLLRKLVGVEPLASAAADELVATYAPVVQRYLEVDLP